MKKVIKKLEKEFSDIFHCEIRDDTVLALSLDKSDLPFCFFIYEQGMLLVSFAVNFTDIFAVAEICLRLKSYDVSITEPFYINVKTEEVEWGINAEEAFYLESNQTNELVNIEPINNFKH